MYTRAITMGNRLTRFLSGMRRSARRSACGRTRCVASCCERLSCKSWSSLIDSSAVVTLQGYLGVQIAPHHPAGGDSEHDPKSHPGNARNLSVE